MLFVAKLAGGISLLLASLLALLRPAGQPLPTWFWLLGMLGLLFALVAFGAEWQQKQHQLREEEVRARSEEERKHKERERILTSMLARWPPPRASEVNPYEELRITRSEIADKYAAPGQHPPYVPREVDARLDAALRTQRLVLLVGNSKAGKSRTAFEALRRLEPEPRILIPANGPALQRLFRLEPPLDWGPERAVLWLDDLQRFLGPDGLEEPLLNEFLQDARRITVVATLTSSSYKELSTRSELGADTRALLERFTDGELHLNSSLNRSELSSALALYPNEPESRLASGLGEHLVSARELKKKLLTGRHTDPVGYALVLATADWRRAGLRNPIPEPELRQLAERYLPALRVDAELTDTAYAQGLGWARKPISSHVALLYSVPGDSGKHFDVFDYIVDDLERQGIEIPEWTWSFLIERASPEELALIGASAFWQKNHQVAEKAYTKALDSGHADTAPLGAYGLGWIREKRGDFAGAQAAYQRALDSGHPRWAAAAANNIGLLLEERGELDEARVFYQRAIDSSSLEASAAAAYNLGYLLNKRGDVEGARAAFQRAIDFNHPKSSPQAAARLGRLLEEHGDVEGARAAYERAIAFAHAEWSPQAANNLGTLLRTRGEFQPALVAYQRAIDSGHVDEAPLAILNLGTTLLLQGDMEEARAAYQRAIATGHAQEAPWASLHLGYLLQKQGDFEKARSAYQWTLDHGDDDLGRITSYYLGRLFDEEGDVESAIAAYQRAMHCSAAQLSSAAAQLLGRHLVERGDSEGARGAFQRAIDAGHESVVPYAWLEIGKLLAGRGDYENARSAFYKAIHSGRPEAIRLAMEQLHTFHLSPPEEMSHPPEGR